MNPKRCRILILATVLTVPLAGQVVVPTSKLFMTNGDDHRLVIINGSTYATVAMGQSSRREYPIAVNGSIVTAGPQSGEQPGGVYSLTGTYEKAAGTWTLGSQYNFWDGTTDGTYNYAFNYGNGGVYRFEKDWSGGSLLFEFGSGSQYLGITYDATDKTLWVSGWSSNSVVHLKMDGSTLGSFTAGAFSGSLTALALDPADNTLWMGSQGNRGVFAQYTKAGTLVGTHSFGFSDNVLGGEFDFSVIPEPSVTALLSAGAALAGLRSLLRRRRSDSRG